MLKNEERPFPRPDKINTSHAIIICIVTPDAHPINIVLDYSILFDTFTAIYQRQENRILLFECINVA